MITGNPPGCHGIFDFIHCRQTRDGIFFTLNMSYDIRCPTLWSLLTRRGMRVATLNFPVSYPPEHVNGAWICGNMPSRYLKQSIYPPSLYEIIDKMPDLKKTFLSMDMNQELQSIQYLDEEEYEPWINYHIQREAAWFKLFELVFREHRPHLTAIIFDGVDKLQHLCWRFLDPTLVSSKPSSWEARIRHLCLCYFQKLDDFIRQIVTVAGPTARIFIASDHGFGPTDIVFFANAWLARKGYLSWRTEAAQQMCGPANIATEKIKTQLEEIDWNHTRAFALNASSNGIYIRRADGANSPGVGAAEYEGFRAQVAKELLSLTDPYTGEFFFSRVLTREQAFPGDASARAPDLTLFMKDNGLLSVLRSDTIFRRRPEPWGTHYPEGIFIARGHGLVPNGRISKLRIVDVAPILLRSLGMPQEVEMEGRCPDNLFDSLVVPPQEYVSPHELCEAYIGSKPPREADCTIDTEMEDEVLQRLRALGYL